MAKLRPLSQSVYGFPSAVVDVFPKPIAAFRSPTATDTGYLVGQVWINQTSNQAWIMTSCAAGVATWAISSPGASDVDTINSLSPVVGDILIAGGTNISDVNAGNTVTLNLDPAIALATSVTSPLYTSTAGTDLQLNAPAGFSTVTQLGDAAGVTRFSVTDSTGAEVWGVDSNGGVTGSAGLVITGILTQTAGAVNIGMDNLGSAINIGGGNVIKALAIGGGAAAHTIAIGSAAAGAITVDSAAGISLDGATASNFTVTGAGLDLSLLAVGGSINIGGSQAAVDAVNIDASNAAGGIDIDAGTGGITIDSTGAFSIDGAALSNISVGGAGIDLNLESALGRVLINGEEAAADAVRILSAAGGLDTNVALQMNLDSSQAAATAVRVIASNAAGGIDIDSGTGGITIDSTGVLSLDSAGATNLTATGAFDVTVSSTTGSVIVSGGEAAADAVQITASNAGAGGVLVTSGIGGVALNAVGAAAPITLDAVGVVELNSSGAAISVGNDAANFAVNVGTAGTRTVTVGSGTAGSSTVINSGTGAANFATNATDHTTTVGSTTGVSATIIQSGSGKIDFAGVVQELTADFIDVSGDKITFRASPIAQSTLDSCVIPTGVAATTDLLAFENGMIMEQFIIGTQTILAPRMGAAALGLTVSCDLTNAEGKEYNFGAARTSAKHHFTIGTSPAFFMELRFTANDVSSLEPAYFGFRQTGANNAAYAAYNEFCFYGLNDGISPGDCAISTRKAAGAVVNTDTNDAWVDASTHTLRIHVSAAGVVTFLFDGAPPTVTQAFTFTNGIVVHPVWTHLFNATVGAGDEIYWISMECGNL